MKPIDFPEANKVYAKDQKEYLPLPAFHNYNSDSGEVIACWKLTIWERLKIFWTGKVWSCLLTFNDPLTPHSIYASKWNVLEKKYFTKKVYEIIKNERKEKQ